MGQYDDITEDQLQADLVHFARLVLRLEEEDGLLVSPADLQKILGELRQKLFAWEIRRTRRLGEGAEEGTGGPTPQGDTQKGAAPSRESLRVVREALEREEEMLREWMGEEGPEPDE